VMSFIAKRIFVRMRLERLGKQLQAHDREQRKAPRKVKRQVLPLGT
jgi:hypothetical protein